MFDKAVALLKEKNLSVTFAESCTGGLMAKSITDVPGASNVFPGSAVTYSNGVKIKLTNVSRETIDKYTEVSYQCAREMASGAAGYFGTDIAVSATGYAGPGGGNDNDPVGTVYVGVYVRGRCDAYRLCYKDKTRDEIRNAVCGFAAYMIESEAKKL
ncbi:MAG: CinA family protein [Clostridia bacterium]|nr:CinA family protein [Clostridia bacterium]